MFYHENKFVIILSSMLLIVFVGITIPVLYLQDNTVNANEYVIITTHNDIPQSICNVNVETFYSNTLDMLNKNHKYADKMPLFASQSMDYSQNSRQISQILISATDLTWKNGTKALDNRHLLVQFNEEKPYHSLEEDVTYTISVNNLKTIRYFANLSEASSVTSHDLLSISTDITLMAMCD